MEHYKKFIDYANINSDVNKYVQQILSDGLHKVIQYVNVNKYHTNKNEFAHTENVTLNENNPTIVIRSSQQPICTKKTYKRAKSYAKKKEKLKPKKKHISSINTNK